MKTAAAIAILATLLLGACGGGGDDGGPEAVTIVDETLTVAEAPTGASRSQWSPTVAGPTFKTAGAATIEVCAQGTWLQKVSSATLLLSDIGLAEPTMRPSPSTGRADAVAGAMVPISFTRCATYSSPSAIKSASTMATFHIRTGGGATNALDQYELTIRWTVKATY
jgi:hypothetical protein